MFLEQVTRSFDRGFLVVEAAISLIVPFLKSTVDGLLDNFVKNDFLDPANQGSK